MKRHLMAGMALLAGMSAALAGETVYEAGRVYEPIVILGDQTVTVDGHGAIVDGGGKARCATLGPNVTVRNFTFRNGRAAIGGGVCGGTVEDCTITDCTASEYGAAVANCEVSRTAISGCRRPLGASVTAATHGGIAADSALCGVTITGCRVELGTAVPGFGGIAANSVLDDCVVADNVLALSGDHYGFLFYGGSLENSVILGNSVDSSVDNIAAYMKVMPSGCVLDGDIPLPGDDAYTILFKVPQGLDAPDAMTCRAGKVYRLPDLPAGYRWRRLDGDVRLYDGGMLVFNLAERAVLLMEAVRIP